MYVANEEEVCNSSYSEKTKWPPMYGTALQLFRYREESCTIMWGLHCWGKENLK